MRITLLKRYAVDEEGTEIKKVVVRMLEKQNMGLLNIAQPSSVGQDHCQRQQRVVILLSTSNIARWKAPKWIQEGGVKAGRHPVHRTLVRFAEAQRHKNPRR